MEEEKAMAVDHINMGGGIGAMDADGVGVQPPAQVDVGAVLEALLHNTTKEFGFAPCDVYDGVFNLPGTKGWHVAAMETLEYSKPKTLSNTFSDHCELNNLSHHVVTVQPHEFVPLQDRWTIDFKSARIAREVVGLMRSLELDQLRDMYHKAPEGSGLAGRIFKAIAHRVLPSKDIPQYIPMVSNGGVPPAFSAPNTPPLSRFAPIFAISRRSHSSHTRSFFDMFYFLFLFFLYFIPTVAS